MVNNSIITRFESAQLIFCDKVNNKSKTLQIASQHLKHLMEYAILRGLSRQEMLDVIPHSFGYITDEMTTVSPEEFYAVLVVIEERLKEELTGIRSGRYLNLNALGLIYKISLQATTIEEAFFYLKNYLNATFPIVTIDTVIEDSTVTLFADVNTERDVLNRIILENLLTIMAREIKMMAGEKTKIKLFSPHYNNVYPGSWASDDRFGLRFEKTILHSELKDQSRFHLDLLIPRYLQLIENFGSDESFLSKVRIAVLNLACPELPNLKLVAEAFNITPRTLQRRLQAENTTFRDLMDDLKRQISNMLLLHNRFSVTDISFVLGYSEQAAFIHSFNKWYGTSPQKYRDEVQYR